MWPGGPALGPAAAGKLQSQPPAPAPQGERSQWGDKAGDLRLLADPDRARAAWFPSAFKNASLECRDPCCQEKQGQAEGARRILPSSEPSAQAEGAILGTFIAGGSCLLRAVSRRGLSSEGQGSLGCRGACLEPAQLALD